MNDPPATYDLTQHELFRLNAAYTAIRKPDIRAEFLELVEAWAKDQWGGRD
ncbi:MAG: hypothetical protein AAGK00_09120 [Pseudomonadota bacterium]